MGNDRYWAISVGPGAVEHKKTIQKVDCKQ